MNLTIDLNTIVLLCGLLVNAAIMIGANRQNYKMLSDKLNCHDEELSDLHEKHVQINGRVSHIEGQIIGVIK
jgi:hypothetical protein